MSKSNLRIVRYEERESDSDLVRILIVDDVPTNRAVIKSLLARPSYEFTEASDGEEALRCIAETRFDLVILDVLMPGINGLEVLRIIREEYTETELPVLMLTVKDDIDDVVKALKLGANDYVTRPIDYAILAARINNHISFKRAQDTIREAQAALEQRIAERTYELLQANNALRAEVNERRNAEEKARRSHDRYRTLYDGTPSMFFTLNRAGTVLSANRFGSEQLGYAVEDLVGTRAVELFECEAQFDGGEQLSICNQIEKCFQESGAVHRWEGCQKSKNGTPVWVRITARTIDHEDNSDKALLMVCEDITEAHNLSKELSHQASHDSLTGLVNRGEFELRLQHILGLARKENSSHALCYMDLDQFKIINDTCGHVAGDELLRQLGDLLQRCVRQQDTVARLGGDEFAVLVTHCNLDQATTVANELRRVLEDFRFAWGERTFSIAASIGLVPITQTTDSITGLLSAADTACYAAKDEGRNRIHIYQEDDEELVRRYGEMEWVSRIDSALESDRFQFYFQEIARVDQEQVPHNGHYELLLRMEDESGNLVRPEVFLPAVERFKHSVK
ncbi:MAG: diguanylate cyclase, partial [Gammaproteobacteria bacterium]|nr:diguanylate cyclase [Gammaproteobacteria bacterium]